MTDLWVANEYFFVRLVCQNFFSEMLDIFVCQKCLSEIVVRNCCQIFNLIGQICLSDVCQNCSQIFQICLSDLLVRIFGQKLLSEVEASNFDLVLAPLARRNARSGTVICWSVCWDEAFDESRVDLLASPQSRFGVVTVKCRDGVASCRNSKLSRRVISYRDKKVA